MTGRRHAQPRTAPQSLSSTPVAREAILSSTALEDFLEWQWECGYTTGYMQKALAHPGIAEPSSVEDLLEDINAQEKKEKTFYLLAACALVIGLSIGIPLGWVLG